jgi:hypothetical protein
MAQDVPEREGVVFLTERKCLADEYPPVPILEYSQII